MSDVAGVFRSSCHSPVTACHMLSGTCHSAGRSFPGIAVFGGAKLGFAVFRGADFAGKALTGARRGSRARNSLCGAST
jgi:hypothetical protein